ncbi:hypothetical protein NUW54_g4275 [Trametes sanguinea]|uniref:Uncharacterized protein n=1 Tax=Trametes sanguinea TaxID=158606 RepID=A0ACC1PYD4_9APHY|nr:hypothetical protein NUW54_g4275 [Trametes sanguinea]
MATLSDDTLRKILLQIQQTAVQSQRALNVSKQQIAAKERERRILQLTIEEITSLQEDVNLYKGVGKMFMQVPRPAMEKDLKDEEKELTEDIKNLEKKVRTPAHIYSIPSRLLRSSPTLAGIRNIWRSSSTMPRRSFVIYQFHNAPGQS